MSTTLKIIESKAFIAGILVSVAAIGAVLGFNVPVSTIMTLLTPYMIGVGGLGWNDAIKVKAKMALEHEMKMHALIHGNTVEGSDPATSATRDADGKCVPRVKQAGVFRLGAAMLIAALGIAASLAIVDINGGCKTAEPVVTDVIDCASAEATAISAGFSVLQVVNDVAAALEGGVAGVAAAILNLIKEYGAPLVACAIDNYPESGSGSAGSGSAVVASMSVAVANKHAMLQQYFPGKKIVHNYKKH